jgi:hypothetical protein
MLNKNWNLKNVQAFWGEVAPCNHLLQIYENDTVFLNSLEGFAGSGFLAGETVIVIATHVHLNSLNERLTKQGFKIDKLIELGMYLPLDAEATLKKFMVNNWPDERKFNKIVSSTLKMANKKGRKIKAFGEMVALLWEQGNADATVQLENLWNKYIEKYKITLFCAYPKSSFNGDHSTTMQHICASHSKIISGFPLQQLRSSIRTLSRRLNFEA